MSNYPKTITPSTLKEVDNILMAHEICERYNAHETLINEIERLEHERDVSDRYKVAYIILATISTLCLIGLILMAHE